MSHLDISDIVMTANESSTLPLKNIWVRDEIMS